MGLKLVSSYTMDYVGTFRLVSNLGTIVMNKNGGIVLCFYQSGNPMYIHPLSKYIPASIKKYISFNLFHPIHGKVSTDLFLFEVSCLFCMGDNRVSVIFSSIIREF